MFGKNGKNPIDHRGQFTEDKVKCPTPVKNMISKKHSGMDIESISQEMLQKDCDYNIDYSSAARGLPRLTTNAMDIERSHFNNLPNDKVKFDQGGKEQLKNKLLDVFSILLSDLQAPGK